jgi:PRC-barrel domain
MRGQKEEVRMRFQPWQYRTETGFAGGEPDLTGFSIAAVDGDIGRVDEATYETGESYLVVDTGPWIFGRKVMLPAGVVERIDTGEKTVYVDRTKDQIKDAPEYYDAFTENAEYREELGRYYTGTYIPRM